MPSAASDFHSPHFSPPPPRRRPFLWWLLAAALFSLPLFLPFLLLASCLGLILLMPLACLFLLASLLSLHYHHLYSPNSPLQRQQQHSDDLLYIDQQQQHRYLLRQGNLLLCSSLLLTYAGHVKSLLSLFLLSQLARMAEWAEQVVGLDHYRWFHTAAELEERSSCYGGSRSNNNYVDGDGGHASWASSGRLQITGTAKGNMSEQEDEDDHGHDGDHSVTGVTHWYNNPLAMVSSSSYASSAEVEQDVSWKKSMVTVSDQQDLRTAYLPRRDDHYIRSMLTAKSNNANEAGHMHVEEKHIMCYPEKKKMMIDGHGRTETTSREDEYEVSMDKDNWMICPSDRLTSRASADLEKVDFEEESEAVTEIGCPKHDNICTLIGNDDVMIPPLLLSSSDRSMKPPSVHDYRLVSSPLSPLLPKAKPKLSSSVPSSSLSSSDRSAGAMATATSSSRDLTTSKKQSSSLSSSSSSSTTSSRSTTTSNKPPTRSSHGKQQQSPLQHAYVTNSTLRDATSSCKSSAITSNNRHGCRAGTSQLRSHSIWRNSVAAATRSPSSTRAPPYPSVFNKSSSRSSKGIICSSISTISAKDSVKLQEMTLRDTPTSSKSERRQYPVVVSQPTNSGTTSTTTTATTTTAVKDLEQLESSNSRICAYKSGGHYGCTQKTSHTLGIKRVMLDEHHDLLSQHVRQGDISSEIGIGDVDVLASRKKNEQVSIGASTTSNSIDRHASLVYDSSIGNVNPHPPHSNISPPLHPTTMVHSSSELEQVWMRIVNDSHPQYWWEHFGLGKHNFPAANARTFFGPLELLEFWQHMDQQAAKASKQT